MSGPAFDRVLHALDQLGKRYKHDSPNHVQASCPGPHHKHGDLEPSLSITYKPAEGTVLMYCHVCGPLGDMDAVRDALGVPDADLFDEPIKPKPELLCAGKYPEHAWLMIGTPAKPAKGETWYPREWERGHPIAWKVRQTCKRCKERKFRWRQPDGDRTKPGKPAGVMPLGGLPDLLDAIDRGDPVHVFITEGDSDAVAVRGAGALAVTAGGVTDWIPEHFDQLDGVDRVTVCADADEPGRRRAGQHRGELERRGILHRVVEALEGKDVRDHLEAEHSLDELVVIEDDDQPDDSDDGSILTFRTIKELRAHIKAQGPRKWLIEGIWSAGAYGVLGGEQKTQKTYNALDLALSVGSGTSWLGHFSVGITGPVIVFSGEGGGAAILRSIDSIAESRGLDADELPIIVCGRAPHLSSAEQMIEFEAALARYRPVLVILDPLYLAARGAELGDIYKMGALLEKAQHFCQRAKASLQVIHHYNRSRDKQGPARLSGAGPAEWGRVLIGVDVVSRYTDRETQETHVTTELSVIGGEVADQVFTVHRRIRADDPTDLDSPLHYSVSVTIGDQQTAATSSPPNVSPSAQRIYKILTKDPTVALTVKEIGDQLAKEGRPLTARTIQKALKDLGDRVDGTVIDIYGTTKWTIREVDQQ